MPDFTSGLSSGPFAPRKIMKSWGNRVLWIWWTVESKFEKMKSEQYIEVMLHRSQTASEETLRPNHCCNGFPVFEKSRITLHLPPLGRSLESPQNSNFSWLVRFRRRRGLSDQEVWNVARGPEIRTCLTAHRMNTPSGKRQRQLDEIVTHWQCVVLVREIHCLRKEQIPGHTTDSTTDSLWRAARWEVLRWDSSHNLAANRKEHAIICSHEQAKHWCMRDRYSEILPCFNFSWSAAASNRCRCLNSSIERWKLITGSRHTHHENN